MLKEVAKRLHSSTRIYDGVGRYGGEEFLMVLPGCDLKTAARRANDLRAAVQSANHRLCTPVHHHDQLRGVALATGAAKFLLEGKRQRKQTLDGLSPQPASKRRGGLTGG